MCDPTHRCDFCTAAIDPTETVDVSGSLCHGALESIGGFDHGDLGVDVVWDAAVFAREAEEGFAGFSVAFFADEPPGGFWGEDCADQDGYGPDPLDGEGAERCIS